MLIIQGYATVLSDDGSPLTSYQKHLIALARALIRNPRILLWEEDLSIMDNFALDALTNYLNQVRALISTLFLLLSKHHSFKNQTIHAQTWFTS